MKLQTFWNPLRRGGNADPLADFEDMFRGFGMRAIPREFQATLDMRLDVSEDEKAYRVSIDIPGVKKDDVDVTIDGNQVAISAEVKREESKEKEKELYCERYYGKAFRSFTLPQDVDNSKSEANYDNGVLTLVLPKKANGQAKRVPVH